MRTECCMSHLKGSSWEDVDVCLQEMVETVFVPRRLCLEAELGAWTFLHGLTLTFAAPPCFLSAILLLLLQYKVRCFQLEAITRDASTSGCQAEEPRSRGMSFKGAPLPCSSPSLRNHFKAWTGSRTRIWLPLETHWFLIHARTHIHRSHIAFKVKRQENQRRQFVRTLR